MFTFYHMRVRSQCDYSILGRCWVETLFRAVDRDSVSIHQSVERWWIEMVDRDGGYGVAAISRLLKMNGLFCKRALQKRRYSAKETYHLKEPTNRSHPISLSTNGGCLYRVAKTLRMP